MFYLVIMVMFNIVNILCTYVHNCTRAGTTNINASTINYKNHCNGKNLKMKILATLLVCIILIFDLMDSQENLDIAESYTKRIQNLQKNKTTMEAVFYTSLMAFDITVCPENTVRVHNVCVLAD